MPKFTDIRKSQLITIGINLGTNKSACHMHIDYGDVHALLTCPWKH